MAFDVTVFKERFAQQLIDFKLESSGAWALAANVFVAKIKEQNSDDEVFMFYHDITETHFRDMNDLCREMQIMSVDLDGGALSEDERDNIRVFYFNGHVYSEFIAHDCAKHLLVANEGVEILWLAEPCHTYFL